jgi:uncharacterized membrane protein
MGFARVIKHLSTTQAHLRRSFGTEALSAIEKAVQATESTHGGEIRFVVETRLTPADLARGITPRERALQIFANLGVWDTEANNGVLIYVLLAERDVEIVADRGFNGRVSPQEWEAICHHMEVQFAAGKFRSAAIEAIEMTGQLIRRHFPAGDRNELPNAPLVL